MQDTWWCRCPEPTIRLFYQSGGDSAMWTCVSFFFFFPLLPNNHDVKFSRQASELLPGLEPVSSSFNILISALTASHCCCVKRSWLGNKECTFPLTGHKTLIQFFLYSFIPYYFWHIHHYQLCSSAKTQALLLTRCNYSVITIGLLVPRQMRIFI